MTGSPTPTTDLALEAWLPEHEASLDSIVRTEALRQRPWRPPDYEKENRALIVLAGALADPRSDILQTLAETILEVTQCDSSGLSLLSKEDGGKRFYWPAIAGVWKPHIGGGTPRDYGPCGDVLDQNRTLLFQHFERRYPYLIPVQPAATECLLVPFYVRGKAVGTIWAIMHSDRRTFDAEDERLMDTLGKFASLAYQTVEIIEDLKSQIAAREQAEAAVRALATGLEAKIRRLVDANIMGIFIWSPDGQIIEANEAFLRMVGYSRDDLLSGGLNWRALTPAEWRDADNRRVAELKTVGTTHPYEKEYFRKGGDRVPAMVGAATFAGTEDGGVAFVIDLTERKVAEEAARLSERRYLEARNELAHANRVAAMGQLSASITHEVNQPIAASITDAQAALRWVDAQPPDLGEARLALGRIVKNGHRAAEVIGRIHNFVKKKPPRREAVAINPSILDVIPMTTGETEKNGVLVQTSLADGLPPVLGDPVQLQQVLLNLILNAVEAMSGLEGSVRILRISTAKAGPDGVSVSVQDSGPGIPAEMLNRVFEPFFSTKSAGLGMGLSICRSIIETHQGRLSATVHKPHGTTFSFTLPAWRESDI